MKRSFRTLANLPNKSGTKRYTRRAFATAKAAIDYAKSLTVWCQVFDTVNHHRLY